MLRRLISAIALLLLAVPCIAQDAQLPERLLKKIKPPTGTINGTVYCADTNLPARGAEIFLVQISKGDQGIRSGGTTDLDGRFVVHSVPEGAVYLVAQLPGYLNPVADLTRSGLQSMTDEERKALESSLTSVKVSAGQSAEASLRLERAAEIDGVVQYDDGSPAIGLNVVLKSAKEGADTFASSILQAVSSTNGLLRRTDDRGHFRILGIAPGQYLVAVSVPTLSSGNPSSSNLLIQAIQRSEMGGLLVYAGNTTRASTAKVIKIESTASSQDVDVTVPLSKLHTVRGHVVLKGTDQSPPAATVELLYADSRELARMTIAPNGEFEIHYVPEGSYVVAASASPDPFPDFEVEDGNEGVGAIVLGTGGTSFSISSDVGSNGDTAKSDHASEVPLSVTGDVDNVVIAVPDSPKAGPRPEPDSMDVERPAVSAPQ